MGWAVAVLVVVTGQLVAAGPAAAEPGDVSASECLTGDADPDALVAETSFGWFRAISLYCGNPGKGVIHIAQRHGLDEDGADDDDLVTCMDAILANGDEVAARGGNQAYEAKRSDGGTATLVWEESTDEVVTMFTSDPGGGVWSACAELIDG